MLYPHQLTTANTAYDEARREVERLELLLKAMTGTIQGVPPARSKNYAETVMIPRYNERYSLKISGVDDTEPLERTLVTLRAERDWKWTQLVLALNKARENHPTKRRH